MPPSVMKLQMGYNSPCISECSDMQEKDRPLQQGMWEWRDYKIRKARRNYFS